MNPQPPDYEAGGLTIVQKPLPFFWNSIRTHHHFEQEEFDAETKNIFIDHQQKKLFRFFSKAAVFHYLCKLILFLGLPTFEPISTQ